MIDDLTREHIQRATRKAADACVVHRVMGVHNRNEDGSSRQRYIRRLKPLDRLTLLPAPKPWEPDAIAVLDRKGHQLGYLDPLCARQTTLAARTGRRFEVMVAARWQDPGAGQCLVVAILHLKPGYSSVKELEAQRAAGTHLFSGYGARLQELIMRWTGRSRHAAGGTRKGSGAEKLSAPERVQT